MRFDWDNHKSQLLQRKRGYALEETATILAGEYVERMKSDDPVQFIAIGCSFSIFGAKETEFLNRRCGNPVYSQKLSFFPGY